MKSRTVVAPDGGTWTIRRYWVGRPPKFRWLLHPRRVKDWALPDWLDIPAAGEGGYWWIGFLIVGLGILIFFVIPALVFLVELVLFLVIASAVVFVNSLFRRPWIVVAAREASEAQIIRWKVVGLLRSRRAMREIAEALSLGHLHIEIPEAELIDGEP